MTRERGMVLIEVMSVVILLGVFSVVAAQLFGSILSITDEARDVPRADRRRAELIERMRADAWGAAELRVAGGRELILRYTGDRSVFWSLPPDIGGLRRTELLGTKEQSREIWETKDGPLPEKFERFGPGARIHWPRRAGDDAGVVDLYSQLVSLRGGAR